MYLKVWTNNQMQYSEHFKAITKCSNCPPLALTHAFSLRRHWSSLDQWQSTRCLTNCQSDSNSTTHQHLAQTI